jgi:hypothetical protein
MTPHDPDVRSDDQWNLWALGFLCGHLSAGAIYLLAKWLSGSG